MLAVTHPWWPHLFSWPRVFDPISWLWLSIKGYALTSSWFNVAWIAGLILYLRHHNCHRPGCLRLQWHPDDTGHPVCRVHHDEHPAVGLRARLQRWRRKGAADSVQSAVIGPHPSGAAEQDRRSD